MTFRSNFFGFFIICFAMLFLFSCARKNYEQYGTYFHDLPKTGDTLMDYTLRINDPKIKIGDVLSLSVTTVDQAQASPTATTYIPLTSTTNSQLNLSTPATNTVDKDGMIEYPLIGKTKMAGLTISEAKDTLRSRYGFYY